MTCTPTQAAVQKASILLCVVQPPDWRVYITPALVAVSTMIAFLAVRTTRAVARRRATLDLIEKTESSDHYRATAARFSGIRRTTGFGSLSNPLTDKDKADRLIVVDYLNHYELISIGILNDALDERIYREWMRGPFTRDWNAAADWIQLERWKRDGTGWTYYPRVFANYQEVARRWSIETRLLDMSSGGPPQGDAAEGPGHEALPAPQPEEYSNEAGSNDES